MQIPGDKEKVDARFISRNHRIRRPSQTKTEGTDPQTTLPQRQPIRRPRKTPMQFGRMQWRWRLVAAQLKEREVRKVDAATLLVDDLKACKEAFLDCCDLQHATKRNPGVHSKSS